MNTGRMKGRKDALSFYYFAANYPHFLNHSASLRYSGDVARFPRVAIFGRILQYSSVAKTRILLPLRFASLQRCRRALPARRHLSLINSLLSVSKGFLTH